MNDKVLVIGGGFGGIAAALRLQAKGYKVCLIDRCETLGGRAQRRDIGGYKHDTGPTVITAPYLFDELFSLFGEVRQNHIEFRPLNPWYRFVYQDGEHFNYGGNISEIEKEITRLSPSDLAGYQKLVIHSKKIYDLAYTQLGDQSFHQLKTLFSHLISLIKLRADRSVWEFVRHYIKNTKLRWALSIQPLLLGGNPFTTTSIYGLIHHLEREHGVYFPMGGTQALVDALGDLMERQGIQIKTGVSIRKIHQDGCRVIGAETEEGEIIKAKYFVFNGDPMHLFDTMIDRNSIPLITKIKHKRARLSMGLYVLFFGTTRQYPSVAHHTIWMGDRFRGLLEDIFDQQVLPDDFSLYIHRPTATDKSFAPDGHDSFYVLSPVPHLGGDINWDEEEPRLRQRIIKALSRTILPELEQHITAQHCMTPLNFQNDYLSYKGTGFSLAPLFRQSAWFRFHNKAEGFDNFFLVGAGSHPGAGLPGVLNSAKVLDKLIPKA
ncbi:MAG: phytoene dehydrogenase [Rhodospirillaceae bacterium TMED8]|nr:phytoene dehydrogenase [Magnetovibrio sp.]OUT50808.1 MAG: phytoene dehydrogenase [Rhodospirillaceae bacterium TMED8]